MNLAEKSVQSVPEVAGAMAVIPVKTAMAEPPVRIAEKAVLNVKQRSSAIPVMRAMNAQISAVSAEKSVRSAATDFVWVAASAETVMKKRHVRDAMRAA